MPQTPLNVGVVFGGVSPEHEVSVISSLQAAYAMDPDRYRPVPVYIAKDGAWYTGERLLDLEAYQDLDALRSAATPVALDAGGRPGALALAERRASGGLFAPKPLRIELDVLFLGLHGGEGENGSLQGLCETFNVPYTGSSVFGSALGMDKVLSKMVCRDQQVPVVDFVWFRDGQWAGHEERWLDRVEERLGYPVIVKPARLGSSIGIARADDRRALDAAIEDALRYDDKVIVEHAVQALREINCSVLGDPEEAIPSVLEEPVRTTGAALLTFQEKYMRGGGKGGAKAPGEGRSAGMASLDRMIPAPLGEDETQQIRELAVRVFQLFECGGVARIDFMIDEATGQVYFNEINTIPGSFSFYLWQPTGVDFTELTHRMIQGALKRHRGKNGRVRSYETNLLSMRSLQGMKGAKGKL